METNDSHECTAECERNSDGKCKVKVRQRCASYYERNRESVLAKAAARRRYANQIVAEYEAKQKGLK